MRKARISDESFHPVLLSSTTIVVKLSAQCDITSLHKTILQTFAKEAQELPRLELERRGVDQELEKCMSVPGIRQLEIKRGKIDQKIAEINEKKREKMYMKQAASLLERYELFSARTSPRRSSAEGSFFRESDLERIIDEYLSLAARYIPLSIEREKKRTLKQCVFCGHSLLNVDIVSNGVKICANPKCEKENRVIKSMSSSSKEYDVWNNLLKAYYRFTGTVELKNISIILRDLDIYFTAKGYPSGEYFRRQPLNSIGRKNGTSQELLFAALSELRHDVYKYYMYIGHMYYGWKLWSLDYLLPEMEKNFKRKQEVWKHLSPEQKQGQSSSPTEFRLCMELNHVRFPCDISWFKITDKQKSLEKSFSVYARMCEGAGIALPHETLPLSHFIDMEG